MQQMQIYALIIRNVAYNACGRLATRASGGRCVKQTTSIRR